MINHIDLHGLTIQQGYNKSLCAIKFAKMNGQAYIKIITGRSGKMNKEFERWCGNPLFSPLIQSIKWCDNYGTWSVKIRK